VLGPGAGTAFHTPPVHSSTRYAAFELATTTIPEPVAPTAHSVSPPGTAATPVSELTAWLSGLGLLTTCHAWPSQCSVSEMPVGNDTP